MKFGVDSNCALKKKGIKPKLENTSQVVRKDK